MGHYAVSGNDHASQARAVPGADRGNPGPSGPAVGSRSKKALWHRVHETLQELARRVWCCSATACRPSSFGSASAPQCTKPLALRRRCKSTTTSHEPDCRRLLQKGWRDSSPKQSTPPDCCGGAGPVGKQQRPRRLSRRAGGYCEGTSHLFLRLEPQGRRGWGPSAGALTMHTRRPQGFGPQEEPHARGSRLDVHTELFVYVGPFWDPKKSPFAPPPPHTHTHTHTHLLLKLF